MNPDTERREAEFNANLQDLAELAVGFFQALLNGEAKINIDRRGYRPGEDWERTAISLEWIKKPQEEVV